MWLMVSPVGVRVVGLMGACFCRTEGGVLMSFEKKLVSLVGVRFGLMGACFCRNHLISESRQCPSLRVGVGDGVGFCFCRNQLISVWSVSVASRQCR